MCVRPVAYPESAPVLSIDKDGNTYVVHDFAGIAIAKVASLFRTSKKQEVWVLLHTTSDCLPVMFLPLILGIVAALLPLRRGNEQAQETRPPSWQVVSMGGEAGR